MAKGAVLGLIPFLAALSQKRHGYGRLGATCQERD